MAHNMTNFSSQRYRTSAELRAKINWNPYKIQIMERPTWPIMPANLWWIRRTCGIRPWWI